MDSSPRICVVMADQPVNLRLKKPNASFSDIAALGVSALCDNNLQRLNAEGSEVAGVVDYLQHNRHFAQLWCLALYPQAPAEALEIQPYSRALRGHTTLFAQQGALAEIHNAERFPVGDAVPLSCSDQERTFCWLLERLRRIWVEGPPDQEMRLALIADYAGRVSRLGGHNFVFWEGEQLFAYNAPIDAQWQETSTPHPPLACLTRTGEQGQALDLALHGYLKATLHCQQATQLTILADADLLPVEATVIPSGTLVSYQEGEESGRCEAVSFWP